MLAGDGRLCLIADRERIYPRLADEDQIEGTFQMHSTHIISKRTCFFRATLTELLEAKQCSTDSCRTANDGICLGFRKHRCCLSLHTKQFHA